MAELQIGKYELYPYPKEFREPPPTLDELVELLRKAKADKEKDVKMPLRSLERSRPHRKRRGYAPRNAGSVANEAENAEARV